MTKETYRERRGLPSIELLMKDLRYAARSLKRRPALTLPIVLTLALGIGANSAIFSAIDTVLLNPFLIRPPIASSQSSRSAQLRKRAVCR
jgi:hypothetical protein